MPPPPLARAEKHAISFPRCLRIRVVPSRFTKALPTPPPRREAKRRKARSARPHQRVRPPPPCSLREENTEGARLPALHRGSGPGDLTPGLSIRAALHANGRVRTLPAPPWALKRCTSRTGHTAGRVDARTARERGDKPRPQEPHSPHRSAVAGRRPSTGERTLCIYNSDNFK